MRICFVALNAYPAIDPRIPGGFGGIETRSWLFAKALAKYPNFDVSFVVRHHEPLLQPEYSGVKLVLLKDALYPIRDSLLSRMKTRSRFPYRWLAQPRISDLYYLPRLAIGKLLRKNTKPCEADPFYTSIHADLFLTFGVQSTSATVIASAQATGRKAVLFLGSDNDLDERYLSPTNFVSIYRDRADVCAWVLQQADRILCQTESQRQILKERFYRDATIVSNPIDVESWDAEMLSTVAAEQEHQLARYALWVGRADAVHKRPQLLIELARLCPEVQFLMIMNPRDDVVESEVRLSAPQNVTIIREVPFSQMPGLFKKTTCLVNTSSLEGFANTFLQAAISRVPIGSLAVAPEFLKVANAGFFADGNLPALAQFVDRCWNDNSVSQSDAARNYVIEHHSLAAQSEQLATQLLAAR